MVWALEMLLSRNDGGIYIISDASIAAFKKECEKSRITFTLSKKREKYEEHYSAYILEVYDKGQLQEQFWIDPDRGYICPKQLLFNPTDGTVVSEDVSENFILDKHSQKWFPQKVTSSTRIEGFTIYSEVHLMPETLILNQPLPDSVFAMTIPKGMRVDDTRRDDNDKTTFIANQPGRLDLPTVDEKNLDALEWLTPREVRQDYPLPIETQTGTGRKNCLLCCALTLRS